MSKFNKLKILECHICIFLRMLEKRSFILLRRLQDSFLPNIYVEDPPDMEKRRQIRISSRSTFFVVYTRKNITNLCIWAICMSPVCQLRVMIQDIHRCYKRILYSSSDIRITALRVAESGASILLNQQTKNIKNKHIQLSQCDDVLFF